MSRIGKMPVTVPSGTTVTVNGQTVTAKGKQGELSLVLPEVITPALNENELVVTPRKDLIEAAEAKIKAVKERGRKVPTMAEVLDSTARTQWGTARANVANMVHGVSEGFKKELELKGVGYRAQMQGKNLKLALGYSHDVIYETPEGIKIEAPSATEVIVSGPDKAQVGQAAAEIRKWRPPEPYKGKGIRYKDEYVRRKEGKKK